MGCSGLKPVPDRWWEDITASERVAPMQAILKAKAAHGEAKDAAVKAAAHQSACRSHVEVLQQFAKNLLENPE